MKRYSLILIALFFITSGCISVEAVRYSPAEIKDYPDAVQEHIKKGEIVTGMTPQQVRYAWGPPTTVNIPAQTEKDKYIEEWIYKKNFFGKSTLIFIDGKLVHIVTK